MRNTRFLLALSGLLAVTAPFLGGAGYQASAEPIDLSAASTSPSRPLLPVWDDEMEERLRRIREKLGNPGLGTPLKDVATLIKLQIDVLGLPAGLSGEDLAQLEADAVALRDCASSEPKPNLGTDFELVVLLHDLGNDLLKHIDVY